MATWPQRREVSWAVVPIVMPLVLAGAHETTAQARSDWRVWDFDAKLPQEERKVLASELEAVVDRQMLTGILERISRLRLAPG